MLKQKCYSMYCKTNVNFLSLIMLVNVMNCMEP